MKNNTKHNIVQRFKIQSKFQYFQIAHQPWKQASKKEKVECVAHKGLFSGQWSSVKFAHERDYN